MTHQYGRGSHGRALSAALLVATIGLALACGPFGKKADSQELARPAQDKLSAQDLPGARAECTRLLTENPESVYVAQFCAYPLLLEGKLDEADALLAKAEAFPKAVEEPALVKEIKLRRALVALRGGEKQFDNVKKHGQASELPAGLVLAAEVLLADAESDEALKLFKTAASDSGVAGQTAQKYIEMLEAQDQVSPTLAEATALWALGQRTVAVESAEDLVKGLPEERADKNEQLLLWAGRAVTAGKPVVASGLLDAMGPPPEGQAWRVEATKAMIAIAEGDTATGIAIFTALSGQPEGVPADGLADALATAAALTKDPAIATQLAGAVKSSAAARGLYEAGAADAALAAAPEGGFKAFLEGRP